MKKFVVGDDVALYQGCGKPELGDRWGHIIKAVVIEVDPKMKCLGEHYKSPPGTIWTERTRFSTRTNCYALDPAGEPKKGLVLLRYEQNTWLEPEDGPSHEAVEVVHKKQRVPGTWAEHIAERDRLIEAVEAKDRREAEQRAWDLRAVKEIKKKLGPLGTGSSLDHQTGKVDIYLVDLLKALGIDIGDRP